MTRRHDGKGFDAVVIGSGMGGLSAAVLLGRLHGKRVLVLERHYRAGGYTHTFTRKGGYRWDVGVHYVGNMQPGSGERDLVDVVTGAEVQWSPMPDVFERLVYPDFEVGVRKGREGFRDDLAAMFPAEAAAIDQYFADVERARSYMGVIGARGAAPAPVGALLDLLSPRARKLALATTGAHLATLFRDARLRSIVGARWGDYGEPPETSAFLAHAVIHDHYFNGGFYPVGSSARLAETAARALEATGGELRVHAEVRRVLIEKGRAVGVELTDGEQVRAPVVISDAGARNTYLRLVPDDVPLPFRDELRATAPSRRFVTLFLGLDSSPRALGANGENLWIHRFHDQDEMARRSAETLDGRPPLALVCFPSLKDPTARAHTGEIIAPVDATAFEAWSGTRWMKRGAEYESLKHRIAEGMLDLAERRLPGLRAMVRHRELSTPLSAEHFTSHFRGESYGVPVTPERFQKDYLRVRTPVAGLYLTGADALMLGVVGAMRAGQACASAIAGPAAMLKIASEARRVRAAQRATREEPVPSSA